MVHGVRRGHGSIERRAGVVDGEAVGLLNSGSRLRRAEASGAVLAEARVVAQLAGPVGAEGGERAFQARHDRHRWPNLFPARPGPLGHGDHRQLEDRLGTMPARQRPGHVASDDERQLVTWPRRIDLAKRIDRVRRPVAVDLERLTSSQSPWPSAASRHIARRWARPGSSSISLCGGTPVGTSSTRSSESCARASLAHTMCARCGGLNVPPRIPIAVNYGRARRPRPGTSTRTAHADRSVRGRAASASNCRSPRPFRTRRRR